MRTVILIGFILIAPDFTSSDVVTKFVACVMFAAMFMDVVDFFREK